MTAHAQTARTLATRALELYRLVLAAEDARTLHSPRRIPAHTNGVPRPTEDAALCPHRARVAAAADRVARQLPALIRSLDDALREWEDPPAPRTR